MDLSRGILMRKRGGLSACQSQPRVGVGVLVVDECQRILLTLRKRPPEAGYWSIVSGRVEFMETIENCAIREAFEEVGLTIALDHLLCVTDHILPTERQHWLSPAYLARIVRGELCNREPEKTTRARWFPIDKLPRKLTVRAQRAIRAYTDLIERGTVRNVQGG
jgi:8-oxo-dGTP diphosphatase